MISIHENKQKSLLNITILDNQQFIKQRKYYLIINIHLTPANINNQKKMIDKKLECLKFQTSVHHKQNLRSAIDPRLIDQLDISPTPSTNYKNAYKNLYQDELQKSVNLHQKKKNIEKIKDVYDTSINNQHYYQFNKSGLSVSDPDVLKHSNAAQVVKNLNYRDTPYQDYDLYKQTKALEHIHQNYDGGQNFYKQDQKHKDHIKIQNQRMKQTLTHQLRQKQYKKYSELTEKQKEQLAMRQQQNMSRVWQQQELFKQKQDRQNYRNDMVKQIEDQRIRRGRRSLFNYNNAQRHNPITNPIQYHIDNPYILKQIQNQKMYR